MMRGDTAKKSLVSCHLEGERNYRTHDAQRESYGAQRGSLSLDILRKYGHEGCQNGMELYEAVDPYPVIRDYLDLSLLGL